MSNATVYAMGLAYYMKLRSNFFLPLAICSTRAMDAKDKMAPRYEQLIDELFTAKRKEQTRRTIHYSEYYKLSIVKIILSPSCEHICNCNSQKRLN